MPDETKRSSPAADGDDAHYEAFVRLLVESEPRMRSYLRGLLPTWHEVEEVAQEASLVAWRKFAQFEQGTNFPGWLLTIARFEALKYRRRVARSPLVFSEEVWELLASEDGTTAEPATIRREALEFKRPGDRVRMNLDGTYAALTFACWVKVDSVDKKYNSLLLTDGYDSGEPHWQIYEDGGLMFSISYPPDGVPLSERKKANQMYFTKPVFTADSLGRWHHLAVTYDNETGTVLQYFDGQEVSREVSKFHQPGRPIVFGPCEIGNWGLPTQGHQFPIRNLNGAIDEFAIYGAALSAEEVRRHFEAGKPE